MAKIVIFTGGSGSTQLQKGLVKDLGINPKDISLILNMYDNGKSTGECRKSHNILGPSDLRKNQMLGYKLRWSMDSLDSYIAMGKLILGMDGDSESNNKFDTPELGEAVQDLIGQYYRTVYINEIMDKRFTNFKNHKDAHKGIISFIETTFNNYLTKVMNEDPSLISPEDLPLFGTGGPYREALTSWVLHDSEFFAALVQSFFFNMDTTLSKIFRKLKLKRLARKLYKFKSGVKSIDWEDFSLGNIMYTALISHYGSVKVASEVMADFLGTSDNVYNISEDNLYLTATSELGDPILGEEDIVDWGEYHEPNNRISEVHFVEKHKISSTEIVDAPVDYNPLPSVESLDLIENADIIIFSTGTLYSSIIPTLMHDGVPEAILASNAKKYFILNNEQDTDMTGYSAQETVNIFTRYMSKHLGDAGRIRHKMPITIIQNSKSDFKLTKTDFNKLDCKYDKLVSVPLTTPSTKKRLHDSTLLVNALTKDYYRGLLDHKKFFIFDYDDTVVDSRGEEPFTSADNLQNLIDKLTNDSIIVSGNSIDHFASNEFSQYSANITRKADITEYKVFCNGGNTAVEMKFPKTSNNIMAVGSFNITNYKNLYPEFEIDYEDSIYIKDALMYALNANRIEDDFTIEDRGNNMISVRGLPGDMRSNIKASLDFYMKDSKALGEISGDYKSDITGKTTIDITKKSYNKAVIIERLINDGHIKYSNDDILYIGDGFEGGNDRHIKALGIVDTYPVKNVSDTSMLIKSIILNKELVNGK